MTRGECDLYYGTQQYGGLAQSVERWNHNPQVTGSSPVAATRTSASHILRGFFLFGERGGVRVFAGWQVRNEAVLPAAACCFDIAETAEGEKMPWQSLKTGSRRLQVGVPEGLELMNPSKQRGLFFLFSQRCLFGCLFSAFASRNAGQFHLLRFQRERGQATR